MRQDKIRSYLMETVSGFSWCRQEPKELSERGRRALLELARRIQEPYVKSNATVRRDQPHEYFYHLYEAKKALEIGRYGLACHELEDVLHLGQQLSWQVLYNILKLIRTYLEE